MTKSKSGFTLAEILIILVIISIVSMIFYKAACDGTGLKKTTCVNGCMFTYDFHKMQPGRQILNENGGCMPCRETSND